MEEKVTGSIGGKARATALSPEQRKEIAQKAATARWEKKHDGERKNLPKATHQGILKIGENELNCAVLEDGMRILSRNAIFKAFGRTKRGRKKDEVRVLNMPSFIDANNLQPFIDETLRGVLIPIQYYSLQGREVEGYRADILPLLCDVYLNARSANSLTKPQLQLAIISEIMVRSLSKVGISALVDEATGYQAARDKDSLQQLLALYLSEEKLKWAKMFPDEYYKHLFRLRGWVYSPVNTKRTQLIGKLTNQLVYEKLPPRVLEELRRLNPVVNNKTGRRLSTHHQYLSTEIGQADLRDHLLQLIAVMRLSPNWKGFLKNFQRAFPGEDGYQDEFAFDEAE